MCYRFLSYFQKWIFVFCTTKLSSWKLFHLLFTLRGPYELYRKMGTKVGFSSWSNNSNYALHEALDNLPNAPHSLQYFLQEWARIVVRKRGGKVEDINWVTGTDYGKFGMEAFKHLELRSFVTPLGNDSLALLDDKKETQPQEIDSWLYTNTTTEPKTFDVYHKVKTTNFVNAETSQALDSKFDISGDVFGVKLGFSGQDSFAAVKTMSATKELSWENKMSINIPPDQSIMITYSIGKVQETNRVVQVEVDLQGYAVLHLKSPRLQKDGASKASCYWFEEISEVIKIVYKEHPEIAEPPFKITAGKKGVTRIEKMKLSYLLGKNFSCHANKVENPASKSPQIRTLISRL
jgi:hypothetical protein